MGEQWISTPEGRHLAKRRSRDTSPERTLRKALHAAGARFRLHRRLAKGCTPDLVLPGRRVAVFVDGCFWHSCPEHGRKTPWTGPNASLWEAKLRRTIERDAAAVTLAQQEGWYPVRVWECDVRADVSSVVHRVLGNVHEP